MHHHSEDKVTIDYKDVSSITLVGNSNVGKSVIFNLLTGRYVTVSNYPGTTVEVSSGIASFGKDKRTVVDTPGIASIVPLSEDERVTRNMLLDEAKGSIVQVADSKDLRRSLVLAIQLVETGRPLVLALNMADEARQRGITIDLARLSQLLGVGTVETVATEKEGVSRLIKLIDQAQPGSLKIEYPQAIEAGVKEMEELLPESGLSKRSVALMLLAGDLTLAGNLLLMGCPHEAIERMEKIRQKVQSEFGNPVSYVIYRARIREAERIARLTQEKRLQTAKRVMDKLGNIAMSPVWGIPILLLVMFGMYKVVGQFAAGTCVDFIENSIFGDPREPSGGFDAGFRIPFTEKHVVFGHLNFEGINWYLSALAGAAGVRGPLYDFFLGKYGLISMGVTYAIAIVMPIMFFFFLMFGFLEDTGYLARLTVLANRLCRKIGLSGKAVLPMALGLGCGTMAVLTARILDTKRERTIAILLLALGVPCSAQLGVIFAMLSSISAGAVAFVFCIVMMQVVIVGYAASKALPGEASDFIIEVPPLRMPRMENITVKTWARLKWFTKEAVPLFLLGTSLLFVSDMTGILRFAEKVCAPVVENFLGLPVESTWAFIIGFLRRDYGAAGLFAMQKEGLLDIQQVMVSMIVITLFVPCIAQGFVTIKEQGLKKAGLIFAFVMSYAVGVGTIVNFAMKAAGW